MSFDTFLRFLDCPEVPSESEAISEQCNAIVLFTDVNIICITPNIVLIKHCAML